MSRVVHATSLHVHRILFPVILSTFLIFSVSIRPIISAEVPLIDASPLIKIYKGGRVERLADTKVVPPCFDPKTNVESKDTLYSKEPTLFARLYLPKNTPQNQKLPLLVYFHGGAFVLSNASNPVIHNFLNALVSETKLIAVSVAYRLAPEHPLPAAYDDSWAAVKWVASHVHQKGPDGWLNCHADFQRVFLAGDSAGANIAHQMAIKFGQEKLAGVHVTGLILCHPFFWGTLPIPGEAKAFDENVAAVAFLWYIVCPTSASVDDPWMNPSTDPNLGRLGCTRVQVFVSQNDFLRERGRYYAQKLKESGWKGNAEVIEYKGEPHDFHLANLYSKNSVDLRHKIVAFINH